MIIEQRLLLLIFDLQLIHEAASYVNDEELKIDVDDVIEFIGDIVPPLLSVTSTSAAQCEGDSPCEMPQSVVEILGKVVEWTKKKKKFEVKYTLVIVIPKFPCYYTWFVVYMICNIFIIVYRF